MRSTDLRDGEQRRATTVDGRAIQKVQGPVSAEGKAPRKGSVRGRGTYGSSASRGLGTVAGISPFRECLNLSVLFVCLFLGIRCCGVWHMQCLRALW